MPARTVKAQYGTFTGSKYGFGGLQIQGESIREMVAFLKQMEAVPTRTRNLAVKRMAEELLAKSLLLAPDSDRAHNPEYDDAGQERKWDRRGYRKLKESASVMKRKGVWIVRYSTRHAAAQHERMDYQRNSGQAKYLEQPLMEMRSTFRERIVVVIQDITRQQAERTRRKTDGAA